MRRENSFDVSEREWSLEHLECASPCHMSRERKICVCVCTFGYVYVCVWVCVESVCVCDMGYMVSFSLPKAWQSVYLSVCSRLLNNVSLKLQHTTVLGAIRGVFQKLCISTYPLPFSEPDTVDRHGVSFPGSADQSWTKFDLLSWREDHKSVIRFNSLMNTFNVAVSRHTHLF